MLSSKFPPNPHNLKIHHYGNVISMQNAILKFRWCVSKSPEASGLQIAKPLHKLKRNMAYFFVLLWTDVKASFLGGSGRKNCRVTYAHCLA